MLSAAISLKSLRSALGTRGYLTTRETATLLVRDTRAVQVSIFYVYKATEIKNKKTNIYQI